MNNEALVIVDAPHEDVEKILAFIQTKTKGLKGEEHEILDSFPILYVRNEDHQICKELAPYIAEELIFDNGTNQAEQSYEEIIELLDTTLEDTSNPYTLYEQKLLLLSLTHRLCAIYSRRFQPLGETMGRKHEVFIQLIKLIEEHYTEQRSVEFYADKLCLTPKYLSALSKEVCGYTVQELVFKSVIRKAISLLKNTQKSAQEISNELNFPNPSYFGTFFKKQTGLSPQQYRNSLQD